MSGARKISWNKHMILLLLLIFWAAMIITNPAFRNVDNLLNILRESAFTGITALGMTYCIIMGDFDLSVGSMLALMAVVCVRLLNICNMWLAFILILILGVICGAFNGFIIAYLKISAFIVTLGTFYIFRAAAYIITDGKTVVYSDRFFMFLGNGSIMKMPVPFCVFVILAAAASVILRHSVYGRSVIGMGNSPKACEISGINTKFTKMSIFIILGGFTAVSAILTASRQASAGPGMAGNFHFDAITMVVLGGTSLAGGEGSIFNTVIAAVFYTSMSSCMNLYQIDTQWQRIFMGLVLLAAFSADLLKHAGGQMRRKRNLNNIGEKEETT